MISITFSACIVLKIIISKCQITMVSLYLYAKLNLNSLYCFCVLITYAYHDFYLYGVQELLKCQIRMVSLYAYNVVKAGIRKIPTPSLYICI